MEKQERGNSVSQDCVLYTMLTVCLIWLWYSYTDVGSSGWLILVRHAMHHNTRKLQSTKETTLATMCLLYGMVQPSVHVMLKHTFLQIKISSSVSHKTSSNSDQNAATFRTFDIKEFSLLLHNSFILNMPCDLCTKLKWKWNDSNLKLIISRRK